MVWTRSQRIRHAAEGRLAIKTVEVRERIFSSLGYDAELPMRACQLEVLDTRSRELEYAHYFYESFFPVFIRDSAEREREFCKAKGAIGGKWGKCVEFVGRQFRNCTVAEGEEYIYLLADLEIEKRDRGIDESISLEYFDGDVRSYLSEGFLYYLSQLEYGLSLPLTNLAKGVGKGEKKVWRITPEDVLQFFGVKNFKASGGSYFCASVTRRHLFDLNLAGQTLNDNIIWVKCNFLQRDDEELLDLRFRSVKQKKVVEGQSASMDDLKEVEERARLAILQGKEDMSQMVVRLVKGIWLGIEEQESKLKKAKSELEINLARAKTEALKEVRQLKAAHAIIISQLQAEAKANLDETVEEHDRLGHQLMLKGYSQEEVDAIKADTYVEEDEEEAEVLGVIDGLDGISPQTVLDNQGDDAELLEGGSEKEG
ncbi:hypothetical protein GIB67_017019 [Kingdonia uniflora]|uniref:Uncharacterized protein n=1 Tax=Kingdonia uniflora TaxID=39325 RepID=A0A7J7LRZ7_9MAGN|nr:hypothetical protein GIB67_017019 [Kingdonia uniflora]